jgi:hypothetical protein
MKLKTNKKNMKRLSDVSVKNQRSSVLKKTLPFLSIIYNSSIPKKSRLMILKKTNGNPDLLNSIREIAHNIKKGNLKIKGNTMKKNAKYIDNLLMTTPKKCIHPGKTKKCRNCKKQSKLIQKGDNIFAAAIPVLSLLATSIFSK